MSSICEIIYYIPPKACSEPFVAETIDAVFGSTLLDQDDVDLFGHWSDQQDTWIEESDVNCAVRAVAKENGSEFEFTDSTDFNFQLIIRPEPSDVEPYGIVGLRFDRAELRRSPEQKIANVIEYSKRLCLNIPPIFAHGGYELNWIDFDPRSVPDRQLLRNLSWINFIELDVIKNMGDFSQIDGIRSELVNNHQMILLSRNPNNQAQIEKARKKIIDTSADPHSADDRK